MNARTIIKTVLSETKKKAPTILACTGAVGVITTAIFASKATLKADEVIKTHEVNLEEPLTIKEKIKLTWKYYVPTFLMGTISITSILVSNRLSTKQTAIFATAATAAERTLQEYQKNLVDIVEPNKVSKIEDAIAKTHLEKTPVDDRSVIPTQGGTVLCFDDYNGRYFRSDAEKIRQVVNDANEIINSKGEISLNDFYYLLGLPKCADGDERGWNLYNNGLIDVWFYHDLATNYEPVLCMGFRNGPIVNF